VLCYLGVWNLSVFIGLFVVTLAEQSAEKVLQSNFDSKLRTLSHNDYFKNVHLTVFFYIKYLDMTALCIVILLVFTV